MRAIAVIMTILLSYQLFIGCNEGTGNPFTGSQWDVGQHHVSFSHAVAEWNTAENALILKFDLLSGSTYPDAVVRVEEVSTLTVNVPREVTVNLAISQTLNFECDPDDPDASATITFTRFDLAPLGAVSGYIEGNAKWLEEPGEAPVALIAQFENVIVTN